MPVFDHEVHPLTRNTGQPYGCHSQPRNGKGYFVQTRQYQQGGVYQMVNEWVPNQASKLCRYDQSHKDPRCQGCTAPSDDNYLMSYGL